MKLTVNLVLVIIRYLANPFDRPHSNPSGVVNAQAVSLYLGNIL